MAFLPKTTNREEYRKNRELDEARKAGKAEHEVDVHGNVINPHIPDYIKSGPWYITDGKTTLQHQRKDFFGEQQFGSIDTSRVRGKSKFAATSYVEGSCENCGSGTHTAKFCVERPRKKGAKFTGKDIQPDEHISDVPLDYEGKHDRWNGFQPEMYKKYMDEYKEEDAARKRKIMEERAKAFMTEPDGDQKKFPHQGAVKDDVQEGEGPGYNATALLKDNDPKTRTAMRNLRSREDRAKYLHNLEEDSAFYDPKSRSMRENPNIGKNPDEYTFAGDNENLLTGDTLQYYEMQRHAWESYGSVNVNAPSESEVFFEEFKRKKLQQEEEKKKLLATHYGGDEHTSVPPTPLLLGQTEEYIEYNADGVPLPKYVTSTPRSKYVEDVLIHNHTSVWGSYYNRMQGKFGYQCCKQLHKMAFCTLNPA